jgi:hypothetical protein
LRLKDEGSFSQNFIFQQLIKNKIIPAFFANTQKRLTIEEAHAALKAAGYDGVVYLNRRESVGKPKKDMTNRGTSDLNSLSDAEFKEYFPEAHDSYIVFDKDQIKSSIGNIGTYGQRPPTAKELKNIRPKLTVNEAREMQRRGDMRFSFSDQINTPIADWDLFYENLIDNLDSFSPARDTGRGDYDLNDVAQRFVDYAKRDNSGESLTKIVNKFSKNDDASPSQIRKLREAVRDLESRSGIRYSLEEPSEKDIAQARSEYRKSKAHNLGEFFDHLYRQGIPLPEVNRLVNAHILAEKYPTGHGEQRLSKFAQRMKNRFEDFEFVLADQPQYLGMNMGISRAKAEKLAQNDPVMARRITFGMANAPADVANFHVGIALISQLEAQGKFDEAAPLISALSRQATRKGQEIAALRGNINDFDPLRFVQRTIARRRIARSGYFRSGEKATQTAIENITKHLQAALEASNLTAEEVSNYIKKITCVT